VCALSWYFLCFIFILVEIYDKFLSAPQHRDRAKALHLLGRIYVVRQDDQNALIVFRQTLQTWKVTLRPGHPDLILCMKDMARLYWRQVQRSLGKVKHCEL
jgi:hypothetical protein